MTKWILYIIGIVLVFTLILVLITINKSSKQTKVNEISYNNVSDNIWTNLSKAIQIATVSALPDSVHHKRLSKFHSFLLETYPDIFSKLDVIEELKPSLLLKWKGKTDKSVVICAHMDVVPAENISNWKHAPFSGHIDDEYVWGRGALDDKGSLISILEALNALIKQGYKPEVDIYFAFGIDEEVGGLEGAKTIASWMEHNNIKPEYVYDEGLAITHNMIPGLKKPAALIGTSEKGYLTVEIAAEIPGGHSSTPPLRTSIGVLNKVINKILDNRPNAKVTQPVSDFIDHVGPELPFTQRIIFANKWLFKPLILKIYSQKASSNALVRTTTAPTIYDAGSTENAIPNIAKAIINFRLLPGDSSVAMVNRLRLLANDSSVSINAVGVVREAANVSSSNTKGFASIQNSIKAAFGNDIIVSPALMLASSDGRHYANICDNIYRFAPIEVNSDDLKRIHGYNERIKKVNLKKAVIFYQELIKSQTSN